jgi:hypothetical protein
MHAVFNQRVAGVPDIRQTVRPASMLRTLVEGRVLVSSHPEPELPGEVPDLYRSSLACLLLDDGEGPKRASR